MATVASIADLVGLSDARDAAIRRYIETFGDQAPRTAGVFRMIRDSLAAKPPGKLDLPAVDKILASIPKPVRGNTAVPVAARLTADGRPDEARRYWQMVADGQRSVIWWQTIARSALRKASPKGP